QGGSTDSVSVFPSERRLPSSGGGENSPAHSGGGPNRGCPRGKSAMNDLNRRQLLAGAAAIGAAAALSPLATSGAEAAVAPTGAQAPGFYRYKVGNYECTSINDGARSFPMPDKFVTNVPKEQALAAADAAYMPKGMVTVPFNPQLINTGSKLILIDCGNGVANLEPSKGAVGR